MEYGEHIEEDWSLSALRGLEKYRRDPKEN